MPSRKKPPRGGLENLAVPAMPMDPTKVHQPADFPYRLPRLPLPQGIRDLFLAEPWLPYRPPPS